MNLSLNTQDYVCIKGDWDLEDERECMLFSKNL